ncbi:MAG TPA: NAD(P)-dependent oxidoreductase, partial [Gemmatimonadaceae bacterium]
RSLAEFMTANRDGTANVLETAAQRPPQRFLLVSSFAAAGPSAPGAPIDETRVPAPVTDYGRSKLAAEVLTRVMPFPWTIVRPPVVYGEWDREVLKVFKMARLGIATVIGDGTQELSLVYAGDLAEALVRAATSPATAGRVYFAAHTRTTTSRGFVQAIGTAVGRNPRIVPIPGPVARATLWTIGTAVGLTGHATLLTADKANEFLAPAWTCRSDALTRDTGWTATTDLAAGLQRTADWYREHGWL